MANTYLSLVHEAPRPPANARARAGPVAAASSPPWMHPRVFPAGFMQTTMASTSPSRRPLLTHARARPGQVHETESEELTVFETTSPPPPSY